MGNWEEGKWLADQRAVVEVNRLGFFGTVDFCKVFQCLNVTMGLSTMIYEALFVGWQMGKEVSSLPPSSLIELSEVACKCVSSLWMLYSFDSSCVTE